VASFSKITLSRGATRLGLSARKEDDIPVIFTATWSNQGFSPPPQWSDSGSSELKGEVVALNFNDNETLLAAGTDKGKVIVIRTTDNSSLPLGDNQSVLHLDSPIKALAISPDNAYLAVLTTDRLRIYQLPSN
jgi:WD40 repeat protein